MFGLKERPKPNKKFYLAIASLAIVVLVVAAILLLVSPDTNRISLKMDKSTCESSGGTWNECGSPCMGAPQGTMCIMVCREQCEWHSTSASLIQTKAVYNSQPGFSCMTQDNGILLCWISGT